MFLRVFQYVIKTTLYLQKLTLQVLRNLIISVDLTVKTTNNNYLLVAFRDCFIAENTTEKCHIIVHA